MNIITLYYRASSERDPRVARYRVGRVRDAHAPHPRAGLVRGGRHRGRAHGLRGAPPPHAQPAAARAHADRPRMSTREIPPFISFLNSTSLKCDVNGRCVLFLAHFKCSFKAGLIP